MKVHYDIEQKSDEWFRIKWGKVGGTRGAGLFVKSNTLAIELTSEECEEYEEEDSFQSKAMQRGNELEPVAKERLEEYTGVKFLEAGWIDSDIRRIGISPDGISEDETVQCEIKCPAKKNHTEYCLGGVVPKEYIGQCIHAFLVNPKLEKLYFCSFRPESVKPLFVKCLTRESEVDRGTKTKPNWMTIERLVDDAMIEAHKLNKVVDDMVEKMKF